MKLNLYLGLLGCAGPILAERIADVSNDVLNRTRTDLVLTRTLQCPVNVGCVQQHYVEEDNLIWSLIFSEDTRVQIMPEARMILYL